MVSCQLSVVSQRSVGQWSVVGTQFSSHSSSIVNQRSNHGQLTTDHAQLTTDNGQLTID